MIISENIAFKSRSVLEMFNFSYFNNFSIVPATPKVMTSRWLLKYEVEYNFDYIFWAPNNLVIKHGPTIDIIMGIVLRIILLDFEDCVTNSDLF